MELFRFLCVEDIETLFTHELIANVGVLLVHVIGERLLHIEVVKAQ